MVDYTQKATANIVKLPQAKWWTKWLTPKAKHLGCVRMYTLSPYIGHYVVLMPFCNGISMSRKKKVGHSKFPKMHLEK